MMNPGLLDGLICCSVYLPPNPHRNDQHRHAQLPAYISHGRLDPVLPIELGKTSKLAQHDFQAEWHETALAHTVGMKDLTRITIG